SSASATPAAVPVSLAWPGGSPGCGPPTRTAVASPSPPAIGVWPNPTASAAVTWPSASPFSSSSPLPSSAAGATTAEPGHGTGANSAPGFRGHDARFRVGPPGPAVALGYEQPRTAEFGGERAPGGSVVRLIGLGPGQHRRPRAPVVEQVADRGPEIVLRLLVAEVRDAPRGPAGVGGCHRGRSFQGTRVSVRGSAGRPSTRSAMMFRRISEVPPSIEFPRARRYR